jgi:hypothetical protein
MHRKSIAAIISASIAITAFSANSAAAGDRDTANFLAGLAGLAIIGAIIHDSNKKNKTTNYTSRDTYAPLPQPKHDYGHRAPARQYKHKYGAPSRHKGNVHHNQSKGLYRTACRAKSCRAIASGILTPVADNSGSLEIAA